MVTELLRNNACQIAYLVESKFRNLNSRQIKDLSSNLHLKFLIKEGMEASRGVIIGYNYLFEEVWHTQAEFTMSVHLKKKE